MHAVGSILAIQDDKFMVCGYRPIEQDGMVGMGYLLLPYPLGFMDIESFSLVSADADYPVVHEGFRNVDAEGFDAMLEKARAVGRETTMDEFAAVAAEAADELEAALAAIQGKEA